MYKFLVILNNIKLYVKINIYKHIKKKYGQANIRNLRLYKRLKTKYMKINADLKYIKTCMKAELTPCFVKVNLARKSRKPRFQKTRKCKIRNRSRIAQETYVPLKLLD